MLLDYCHSLLDYCYSWLDSYYSLLNHCYKLLGCYYSLLSMKLCPPSSSAALGHAALKSVTYCASRAGSANPVLALIAGWPRYQHMTATL